MTLTRRERFLIVFGLITVALVAYVFYFLIPHLNGTADAETRIAAAQSELNILNAQAAAAQKLADEIGSMERELAEKRSSVPTGMDHARVLLYLSRITGARADGLSVQLAGDEETRARLSTQAVTVEFRATWQACRQILQELRKNELYHQVEYLKVEYAPETGNDAGTGGQAAAQEKPLAVHMELRFFAFPTGGNRPADPPLEPGSPGTNQSLFPNE